MKQLAKPLAESPTSPAGLTKKLVVCATTFKMQKSLLRFCFKSPSCMTLTSRSRSAYVMKHSDHHCKMAHAIFMAKP
jgi:hypothetical protein